MIGWLSHEHTASWRVFLLFLQKTVSTDWRSELKLDDSTAQGRHIDWGAKLSRGHASETDEESQKEDLEDDHQENDGSERHELLNQELHHVRLWAQHPLSVQRAQDSET